MFWLLMRVDRSTLADCKYTQTICEISLDLYQCNVLKASDVKLYYFVFLKPFDHISISFNIFLQKCNTYLNKKLASRLWNSSAGIVFLFHELHSMWVLHVCSNEIYYSLIQRKRDMITPRERSRLTLYVWTYLESQTAIVWH